MSKRFLDIELSLRSVFHWGILLIPRHLFFVLIFSIGLPVISQADDGQSVSSLPHVKYKESRSFMFVNAGLATLSATTASGSDTAQGLDTGVGYGHAISDRWALFATVKQGINISGFATLYSEIGGGAIYALNSSHIQRTTITQVDNVIVSESQSFPKGGWYIQAAAKQYLFNGSTSVLPMVGPSFGLYYQYPTEKTLNFKAGGSIDYGQNGDRTLLTLKGFAAIQFHL